MASRFASAVSSATVTTATYLAVSSPRRGTGAAISASSVPRSRSPAVKSIAGYTAPVIVIRIRISGISVVTDTAGRLSRIGSEIAGHGGHFACEPSTAAARSALLADGMQTVVEVGQSRRLKAEVSR